MFRVRCLMILIVLCSIATFPLALAQDFVAPVSLIELLARPDKFDGKLVRVQGFLRIGHEPRHGVEVILYLHEEDARNLLGSNAILVIPSKEMLTDEEKIDRMYVMLTGSFHAVHANKELHAGVIKEIRSCMVWSNPTRPIGEHSNDQVPEK